MADREDDVRNPYAAPDTDLTSRDTDDDLDPGTRGHRVIDAGEVVSASWEIFKKRMGITVGGVLVGGIVSNLIGAPQQILNFLAESTKNSDANMALVFSLLSLCCLPISLAGQVFMSTGQAILILKVARGQNAELADLFSGGKYFWRMLGSSILFGLMVFLGFLACVIPGMILSLMFYCYTFALVDEDVPGIECLSRARAASKDNLGTLFLIALAAFGVTVLGVLMLCVGVLFTAPLAYLFFAVAYCKMTGQRTGDLLEVTNDE